LFAKLSYSYNFEKLLGKMNWLNTGYFGIVFLHLPNLTSTGNILLVMIFIIPAKSRVPTM